MKLNYKRTFFIGLAFLSICAFWQLYDNIVPLILSEHFNLNETWTGVIMALDNVIALFLLPFFGTISDKTHTRLGKRTPFILTGTVVSVIVMVLLPIFTNAHHFVPFVISLGILLISMGTYRSPAVALMPDLTPKPLRSKANAVINLMGALGGIITLLFISILIPKTNLPDYTMVFIAVGILMLVSIALLMLTINENKLAKEINIDDDDDNDGDTQAAANGKMDKSVKKSLIFILLSVFLWYTAYNAVTTAFSRYAKIVWGLEGGSFANCLLVATGVAIVSYIPFGILTGKLGRKKTIMVSIVLTLIAYGTACFFTEFSSWMFILFGIIGIGWAGINVNSYPMVVEMSKGSDIGKYTGLYYTFSMAAQVFTPIFSGFLFETFSFKILFPYAVFFSVIALITMSMVKHGDSKPIKKESALEHFDFDD